MIFPLWKKKMGCGFRQRNCTFHNWVFRNEENSYWRCIYCKKIVVVLNFPSTVNCGTNELTPALSTGIIFLIWCLSLSMGIWLLFRFLCFVFYFFEWPRGEPPSLSPHGVIVQISMTRLLNRKAFTTRGHDWILERESLQNWLYHVDNHL